VREFEPEVIFPMLRKMLPVWLMALTVAGTALAGSFEDAFSAQEHGDYATALRLYKSLADQGNAHAQYSLGTMYEAGQGLPQDYAEAAKWYRKAADQGDAHAQNNLGAMYEAGQGVPQDYAEAAKWYRKAADQGAARAQYNLAVLYDTGQGVPRDYVDAYMWYSLAADRLSKEEGRDEAIRGRDNRATAMTPAEIAKARRLARDWKPK
jgi:TPR repeat protein